MDPVSSVSVHSSFVKVLPFDIMAVGSPSTVTRPVMFTLLLAFSFAIISCMLYVDSVSSCYSSVISVKSKEEAVKSVIKTKIHEFPVIDPFG